MADEAVFSYGGMEKEFRETVSRIVKKRKAIDCDPQHIRATNGVAQAMMITAKALNKPSEEAILFDPVDFLFGKSLDAAGAKRVYSRIDTRTREFDIDGFRNLVTPNTRLLCICNPHNPLGRVMTERELKSFTDVVLEHDMYIMSDEIWSDIVYSDQKHVATASLGEEIADRTVSLYGFSKTFGLAGLHLGFMVITNQELMDKVNDAAPGYFYTVNNISQEAGRVAYEAAWYWVDEFLDHLEKIRDYAYRRLNELPGVWCNKPEGTYTLFPNISSYNMTGEEMTKYLRDEAKVAVVPGHGEHFSYFGPGGEGHIRLVFCTGMKVVEEGLDRIEEALGKL
jgi:aspartate/methionine/tyrosine aminotransferase